jgi:hypothetical protein
MVVTLGEEALDARSPHDGRGTRPADRATDSEGSTPLKRFDSAEVSSSYTRRIITCCLQPRNGSLCLPGTV